MRYCRKSVRHKNSSYRNLSSDGQASIDPCLDNLKKVVLKPTWVWLFWWLILTAGKQSMAQGNWSASALLVLVRLIWKGCLFSCAPPFCWWVMRVVHKSTLWNDSRADQLILEWKKGSREGNCTLNCLLTVWVSRHYEWTDEHACLYGAGGLLIRIHFGNLSLMEMQSSFGRGPTHLSAFFLKNLPQFIELKNVLFCLVLKKLSPNPRSLSFSSILSYM